MTTAKSASAVLKDVEQKLRAIWADPAAPEGPPKSRVCTMNLVVVTGSTDLTEKYVHVVDEVVRNIPARAIVVELEPGSPDNTLAGEVTAVCMPEGAREVCSERVRLTARGTVCDRVGSAVEALLVPEMPTALVWLGPVHVDDPVFVDFANDAQRIVLDTEYTSIQSLMQVARWAREDSARPFVADLAWTRLAPWQEMCARFFDEPRLREHALHIKHIRLKQASQAGARLGSEGALLLGWFATRLGWTAKHTAGALRFSRPDGGTVTVDLGTVPRPRGVAPLALAFVDVVAEHGGVVARGNIERELASGLTIPPEPPDASEPPSNPSRDSQREFQIPRDSPRDLTIAREAPSSQSNTLAARDSREVPARHSDPSISVRKPTTIDADVLIWRLDVDLPTATEQRVRLGANRGARLLERTLHRPANDPTLNEAVAFAEQILENGLFCK